MATAFDQFIEEANAEAELFTHSVLREGFLRAIDEFYAQVESFLKPYLDQNKIALTFGTLTLQEDNVGEYEVRTASLRIGNKYAKIIPIGANIIGAAGRIDLEGPYGLARFLYVDEKSDKPRVRVSYGNAHSVKEKEVRLAWKLATTPPDVRYIPFDQQVFEDALMAVVNA